MVQILIIDDDPNIQLLLTRALEQEGYDIVIAQDGEEGIQKAREIKPALIISDWMMPKLTGLEVCRCVKQDSTLATTFFILITVRISVQDRVQGLDAGADDFIGKPIDLPELKARVRAGLRLHQLSQDLQQQKQILAKELAEAAEYLSSLLPEKLVNTSVKIDFCFIPSRQLGGDIFDYFCLDEEHLAVYLLDVSGHGLKAALPSISVLNLLRSRNLTSVNYYQPSTVLARLNQIFPMSQRNDKYFTIWYGVYNFKTRKLIYSGAGHPPAILIEPNQFDQVQLTKLEAKGIPIGMFAEMTYQDQEYQLNYPAKLYLFSDGIYEFKQVEGDIWGLNNLAKLLVRPNVNLEAIITAVNQQNSGDSFPDDLAILEIEFL
jgi:sigma-B regulation protein RsbU (phosphoserine phosphatase)